MRHLINGKLIAAQLKVKRFAQEFKEDNRGVSGIVVAVVLVLIAVLFAALFWSKLQEWFNVIWEKIMHNSEEIG